MKRVSILNNVIGPVMRGPSSSHTAGPWRIATTARELLGAKPVRARFLLHPSSSLAVCYHDQGSDTAFVAGLLGIPMTSPEFGEALDLASPRGLDVVFEASPFPEANHPNSSLLVLTGEDGREIVIHSRSVGGGSFEITSLNGLSLMINGASYTAAIEMSPGTIPRARAMLDGEATESDGRAMLTVSSPRPIDANVLDSVAALPGVVRVLTASPVMHPLAGDEIFRSAEEVLNVAKRDGLSLGEAALAYEAALLGRDEESLMAEMASMLDIMLKAVALGLSGELPSMRLLHPFAGGLARAEADGAVFLGGPHARAAIRAMAALHTNAAGGVVCAAPTGGAAGVLPGVLCTLIEDMEIGRRRALMALWAAGAAGLFHDLRSTFAAEAAGCQVEIGVAGAMGAAAVTEAAGGSALQACDAAATVLQNVMG
ncbi:MAG: L-serine ammonia-lyase, iron-sulfur-dependent, subunit alpha, partial [Synergistota bacterium]|nr:L-serine ammonia-lyase, iron-sulfur-dependent, subunit alpha [Synergistota bacterium]